MLPDFRVHREFRVKMEQLELQVRVVYKDPLANRVQQAIWDLREPPEQLDRLGRLGLKELLDHWALTVQRAQLALQGHSDQLEQLEVQDHKALLVQLALLGFLVLRASLEPLVSLVFPDKQDQRVSRVQMEYQAPRELLAVLATLGQQVLLVPLVNQEQPVSRVSKALQVYQELQDSQVSLDLWEDQVQRDLPDLLEQLVRRDLWVLLAHLVHRDS